MSENRDQDLWRAVIQQALLDATEQLAPFAAKRMPDRLDQIRARQWFTKPNRDFVEVCDLAGLEPSRVRALAIPLIEASARLDPPMPEPARGRPRKPKISIPERQADRVAP